MYLHLHLHYIYITFMWPTGFPSIFSPTNVQQKNSRSATSFRKSRLMEFLVSFIVPPVWRCNFSWTRNERERLTRTGDGPGSCAPWLGWGELNHITHHPKKNGRRGGVVQVGRMCFSSSKERSFYVFFFFFSKSLELLSQSLFQKKCGKLYPLQFCFFLPSVTWSRYFKSNSKVPWGFFFINNSSWESGVRWKQNPLMEEGLEF